MTYLLEDKIRVFVSSRLGECKEERARAKDVIEALGHQVVMFEKAGARPYAPRSVYLRGLEESQIFVGIYREGYGYVEDGMDISGLEDEYRFSRSSGIPQLLYVLRGGTKESRLCALIDEFTGPDITVGYFDDAAELGGRLREDLVALVSEYFLMGKTYGQLSPAKAGAVADALVPPERRVQRGRVESSLEKVLASDPVVLVTGPLGSGKTVLLSSVAEERGWAFVECGERSPAEILADAANAVRVQLDLSAKAFPLPTDALEALRVAWEAQQSITLVLDDVRQTETLDQVREGIQVSNAKRLVLSSRGDIPTAAAVYEVPPFDIDEIRLFVSRNRSEPLMPGELIDIQNASKGNPLYLRYYLTAEPGEFANSISEYESTVWRSLSASEREVLCYLSWSDKPLLLDDLANLFSGAQTSTEEIGDLLTASGSLVAGSNRGYTIFHPHAKNTIRSLTRRSRPRLQFYVERLANWFIDGRDYAGSFSSLHAAGFSIDSSHLEKARRQAVVKGDFRKAIQILHIQIELAKESSEKVHQRDLTLYLAHVENLAGRPNRAIELIDNAIEMAVNTEPPFNILELKLTIGAIGKGDQSAFEHLLEKRENYRNSGRILDAARLSMDLCVY